MGLLAAVADLSLYRFSHRLGGQVVAQLTLACQLLNWFTLFAATRTLTNSLEWALTSLALAHFTALPAPQENAGLRARHEWRFLLIVSVCVLLRPTATVQVSHWISHFKMSWFEKDLIYDEISSVCRLVKVARFANITYLKNQWALNEAIQILLHALNTCFIPLTSNFFIF